MVKQKTNRLIFFWLLLIGSTVIQVAAQSASSQSDQSQVDYYKELYGKRTGLFFKEPEAGNQIPKNDFRAIYSFGLTSKTSEEFQLLLQRMEDNSAQTEASRPKVLSVSPENGTTDVNPNITEIKIVFDRPMKTSSAFIPGKGGEHFPQLTEVKNFVSLNETGTIYTMKVKLKPNWSYEFDLNAEQIIGFVSRDGFPLKPYRIQFQTGSAR